MSKPSDYRYRWTWSKRTTSKETTYGEKVPVYTSQGDYYGSFDPATATQRIMYGASGSVVDASIRLHNVIAVGQGDRLTDKATSEVYEVVGVITDYPNNETKCIVFRYLGGNVPN